MDRFTGKVVVITGAGGPGTGGAAARRFAAEGAKVVASDIDESGLDDLRGSAKPDHGGELVTTLADVVDADGVQALVDFAVATFGQLDVMVNHAVSMPRPSGGGTPFARPLVPDIPPEEWRAGIDGVLNSVFYGAHAAIPHLARTRGTRARG